MDSTNTSQCIVSLKSQTLSFWRKYRIKSILRISRLIVSFYFMFVCRLLSWYSCLLDFNANFCDLQRGMFFGCCFQVIRLLSKCHNKVSAVALSLWKDCFYETLDASYTQTSFLTPVQQGWMLLLSVWIYFSQEQSEELLTSLTWPLFPTEKKRFCHKCQC